MSHTIEEQKERLRKYLSPTIRGTNVDKVLESLASGAAHLINNVEAVNNQLYIVTASGRYLDQRMADRNITRPDNVGLSDEIFREIGIEISNRKQVRDLIMNILRIMYGEEFTRATLVSSELETYALEDGDNLLIQYDDSDTIEIIFKTSQFSSIATATAQEVADVITKSIRSLGQTGSAVAKDDGAGNFVQLISETDGPSSSVRVLGGKAQNKLKFPQIRSTTGLATTQWTFTVEAGGLVRATWTGGSDPSIGKVQKNDYVNIFGTSFDTDNRGTFTITKVQGGLVGSAYVEFVNINGVAEVALQGTDEGMLFFNPKKHTIISKNNFAAVYQTEDKLLEIFMPATARVIKRNRQGAAHLHDSGASVGDQYGPYIYDPSKPFLIGGEEATTSEVVDADTSRIINVADSSQIPDEAGNLIFGFGTSLEEGPVPYIARPSNNTILIDPSYKFENTHPAGTNISLVAQNYVFDVTKDGSDYPFYITDIVSGRLFAEELVDLVVATGINVVITILYPGDEGLGRWSKPTSEKYQVWGGDVS